MKKERTVTNRVLTVFAKEVSGEEIIDDASSSSDGDVHVIRLVAKPIEIVPALGVLGFPSGLLRQPLRPMRRLAAVDAAADFTGDILGRSNGEGTESRFSL